MAPRTPEPPDFPASQLFLRRLAYHLVRDEARAEDLVQETWAAWVEHAPSGVAEPRAWLARVLRNRAFNQKRDDARRARREELAGRPDASAPETDGTLEAQAQLVEALRKLEEPYRSALVQRYYHDLAPKEIAERSGTPLNTVKARLARGLERLRAAMDRRYDGDRRAWCHWLTVLGAPPIVASVPEPSATSTGVGGAAAGSLLPWAGVVLVLAGGAALKALWPKEPRGPEAPPQRELSRFEPGKTERRLVEPRAVGPDRREARPGEAPARAGSSTEELPAPVIPALPVQAPQASVPVAPGAAFDWPQYAGGPEHDTWRERADEIEVPRVRWFLSGLAGVPSLRDGDLYSGGAVLARLDANSGELRGLASPLAPALSYLATLALRGESIEGGALGYASASDAPAGLEELERRLKDPGDPDSHSIAGAPVITAGLVIVRDLDDGSVRAYDRDLTEESWRHEVEANGEQRPEHARIPLCLADDGTLLVVAGSRLIALRSSDGSERWQFSCNGRIRMAPACAGGRVFVGMDKGLFLALSLGTGEVLWQSAGGTFGVTAPVVVGGRLFAADQGRVPWQEPSAGSGPESGPATLRLYDASSGRERWKLGFNGPSLSPLGLYGAGRHAIAAFGEELVFLDLEVGRALSPTRWPTPGQVRGTPAVVGESLVFACADGLYVHALGKDEKLPRRWAFQVPAGAEIEDFVHTGECIYVATSIGLFCLENDAEAGPLAPDFVLTWEHDGAELPALIRR